MRRALPKVAKGSHKERSVLSDKDVAVGFCELAEALAETALPSSLVHVASIAVEVLAVAAHLVLMPLTLVLVRVLAVVLAAAVVLPVAPFAHCGRTQGDGKKRTLSSACIACGSVGSSFEMPSHAP